MVESDFRNIREAEYNGVNYIPSEDQDSSLHSSLHRDPSFSRWFDEDGRVVHSQTLPSENPDTDADDASFDLPSLHHVKTGNEVADSDRHQYSIKLRNGTMQLNRDDSLDHENNLHDGGNGREKYVPFDVEYRSSGEISSPTSDVEGTISDGNHIDTSRTNSRTPVSAVDVLKTFFLIVVWYTFSTFLTLYNKTLLGDDMGKFPAPLLMNTVHFALQAVFSKAITSYWSHRFRPPVVMSWRDYFIRVVPTALGTALDINLSNASLVLISVTFATMCKSAAPIFLLLFAFAFRLESPSIKLMGIIVVISIGVLLTVAKETEFDFWGFVFVMLASVMSGFRWTMTQILLQKEAYGLENPLTFMSYVTPVMAIATLLISLMVDPWQELKRTSYFDSPWHIGQSCLLMLFGGALAFFMVLAEFVLISVTSAVTVTIAGVVKEAFTILVAVFYFGDEFTWLKGAGLCVIMFGVGLFNWYKYQKLQVGHRHEDGSPGAHSSNLAARYVILEEMDGQVDTI